MHRPQEKEHATRESGNGYPGNLCVTAGHRSATGNIARETTAVGWSSPVASFLVRLSGLKALNSSQRESRLQSVWTWVEMLQRPWKTGLDHSWFTIICGDWVRHVFIWGQKLCVFGLLGYDVPICPLCMTQYLKHQLFVIKQLNMIFFYCTLLAKGSLSNQDDILAWNLTSVLLNNI